MSVISGAVESLGGRIPGNRRVVGSHCTVCKGKVGEEAIVIINIDDNSMSFCFKFQV